MSNLKISTADIGYNSTRIYTDIPFFDVSAFTLANSSLGSAVANPVTGASDAYPLVEASDTSKQHHCYYPAAANHSWINTIPLRVSVWAKRGAGTRDVELRMTSTAVGVTSVTFSLTDGHFLLKYEDCGTVSSYSSVKQGDWFLLSFTFTPTSSRSDCFIKCLLYNGSTYTYNGDGSSSVVLYNPHWEQINTPAALTDYYDEVAGFRYYRNQLASACTYWPITFDLGDTYGSKNATADHCIMARGDLAGLTTTLVTIANSSDGVTWTDKGSSSGLTATGPDSHDYVIPFTLTSAARYWRAKFANATANIFQHSKLYIGAWFNFDYDPDYSFKRIPLKDSIWYSSAGAQYFTRNDSPIYQFKFTWQHQKDSTVKNFETKIAHKMKDCPVFLYTSAEHQILNNVGLLHARLTSYKVTKQWNNLNTIEAEFEEELG